jgi:hypothetical protein
MQATNPFLNKHGMWQVDVYALWSGIYVYEFSVSYETHREAEAYANGFDVAVYTEE